LLTRETRSPFRDINFHITLADGRTRKLFLSGLPMFSDTGAFKGFRGTATEISDETAARRNASISRDRLTAAIENISEGFALFDAEDRLVLFNNRFKEYLAGIARFLVPGATFSGIVEAAVNSSFVTGPENALSEWNVLHTEATEQIAGNIELHLASGRRIRISDRSTEDGGVVTIVSDVTDMKNREEALRSSKELAEQGSRSKSEFLANMSHELRTPLNAIIGFTEVMRDQALGPIGNERYQEYIHDILDSGRHLLGVINDILDVSKADAGKLELHEEKVSLKREADATIRLFGDQAKAADVGISANFPNDLPPFFSDQRKIRQIFLNLVSNAVKFTPAGGTVRIDGGLNKEGGVTIQIIDTGIGIKKEDIPAALSAFGQVDSSLARRFDGTGLGLPLTVALIKLHDGDLKLESTPGEGTCISIQFPPSRVLSGPRV
jgi:signal transduction histidine kinase